MIELPLIFLGGLLGSAHCVGMCGGFALLVGAPAPRLSANVVRQLIYSVGRIFTYCAFGAVVGYGGLRLSEDLSGVVNVQAAIAIGAGLLLITQGLISAGVLGRAVRLVQAATGKAIGLSLVAGSGAGCLSGGLLGAFLRDRRLGHVFMAGVFTGMLPCGLVYAYVALAGSTSDLIGGMATMAAFGLGTVPLMVLTGSGSTLLSMAGRQRLLELAAWCVVLTGVISIARGVGFLDLPGWHEPAGCPLCE